MGKIVTLGDAALTTGDLGLLVPPAWLNDQLISFWCEHLRIHVLQNHSQVAILLPNVAYFIALTKDEEDLQPIISANRLGERQLVLIPVNNATDTDIESASGPTGTHWSLLVFHRTENAMFYLDSLPCASNRSVAKRLAMRLRYMLRAPMAEYITLSVPKQTNSYDCGAFVCMFAEKAVRRFLNGQPIATMFEPNEKLDPEVVDSTRQEIGKVACRLFDERNEEQ